MTAHSRTGQKTKTTLCRTEEWLNWWEGDEEGSRFVPIPTTSQKGIVSLWVGSTEKVVHRWGDNNPSLRTRIHCSYSWME